MSPRPTRYEVVHTDAGWHARRRYAGNLQIAWQTEVLTRVAYALRCIATEPGVEFLHREQSGQLVAYAGGEFIEVRWIDERARSQQPTLTASRRQR